MISSILMKNNNNYNTIKPAFSASNQNRPENNKTSAVMKNIKECTVLGFFIGILSSIFLLLDGTGDASKLVLKKWGIGAAFGAATGLAVGMAIDTSNKYIYKDEKKRDSYYKLSQGIFNTGMGATIGSTLMAFTAGDFTVHKWFKGKKLELWGGIAGGLAGALLSVIGTHSKKPDGTQPTQKSINTQV